MVLLHKLSLPSSRLLGGGAHGGGQRIHHRRPNAFRQRIESLFRLVLVIDGSGGGIRPCVEVRRPRSRWGGGGGASAADVVASTP